MASKAAFQYNRNHSDYVALEKLPTPIRLALYESMNDYSCTKLLKAYNKYKRDFGKEVAIELTVGLIRRTDKTYASERAAKTNKPIVPPLYNYQNHIAMLGLEGAY